MKLWKCAFLALSILSAAAFYLHAEENKPAPLNQDFKKVRKAEYLKSLAEREKYYSTMAAEMKALRKACAGEDKETCKKAQDHAKATRAKLQETRKANSDQFKAKMQDYRTKLGKDAPNSAEQNMKALKPAQLE